MIGKPSPQDKPIALGSRERRLLSETIQIEEELIPAFVRPMLGVLAAMLVLFLVWTAVTRLSEVARAPGSIIPSGQIKVVQHLDGGTVAEILVGEHTHVAQGDVLLRLDGAQAVADLRQMEARHAALRLRGERLDAFANGRNPVFEPLAEGYADLLNDQRQIHLNQIATRTSTLSILDSQVTQRSHRLVQLEQALAVARQHQVLTDDLARMREDLGARRLVSKVVLVETRRAKVAADGEVERLKQELDVTASELVEARSRRADTANQLRQMALAELGQVSAERAEVEESLQRLQARVDRLVVRAPNRGLVQDLRVQTVGQVVQPGGLLMQIVPDDAALEAEVRISPRDVGHVRIGLPVNLRVGSYDYTRFGVATGTLKRITASSVVGDDGQPYFRGWVTLDRPYVGQTPGPYPILPGMSVEAEIKTGEKSLLAYLSKPVIDVFTRAFTER